MFKGNIIENNEETITDYWDDYVRRVHLEDSESKMEDKKEQRKRKDNLATGHYHYSASDALQLYAMANLATSSSSTSSNSCSSSGSSQDNDSSYSSYDSVSSSSFCD